MLTVRGRKGHPGTLEDLGSGTAWSAPLSDVLLDPVRTHLRRDPALKGDEPAELRTAALGDDAGLIGVARWRPAREPPQATGPAPSRESADDDPS